MSVTIGIDVGGTKIAAGVVAGDGTILARRRIPTESRDPQAIVAGIAKVGRELRAAAPAAIALGVGAAGLIDTEHGIVRGAPNIAWENVPLRAMLTDRLGLPVVVDNDANVAALAEFLFGAGRDAGDQVMVTVGTGVGGGIIIDRRLFHGARGLGAEIGHIIVAGADGASCPCGNRGCLEAMASGTAIGRMARERAGDARAAAIVDDAGGDLGAITGEMVGTAALGGDSFAREIVAEAGRWLGIGLAGIVNLLDPALIVIGGGVASTGDLLLGPAREAMRDNIIGRGWRTPPEVVPATLGAEAGLVGAAALAARALKPHGLADIP